MELTSVEPGFAGLLAERRREAFRTYDAGARTLAEAHRCLDNIWSRRDVALDRLRRSGEHER